jgi:hypothetical protein
MRLHDFLPLHWCVTPRASIARANFLDGTDAHWFKNLEAFDIVELRALAAVIPQPKELRNVEDEEGEPFTYRGEYSYSMLSEPLSPFPTIGEDEAYEFLADDDGRKRAWAAAVRTRLRSIATRSKMQYKGAGSTPVRRVCIRTMYEQLHYLSKISAF